MLSSAIADADDPIAIPTFHCLGLYWSPAEGPADETCQISYRIAGQRNWHKALPLWFDEHDQQYRGSIVNLRPGTTYEIQLSLGGTNTSRTFTAATWPSDFPVARTVYLPKGTSTEPLDIPEDQSGTAEGYILYTAPPGEEAEIDVQNLHNHCITVRASYIIIRGLTLKGARSHAIRLHDCHDVIIEGCDISNWGRVDADGWGKNYDSAVYSRSRKLERIIIQRNKMHHPRSDSNSWDEYREEPYKTYHPLGPQAVSFFNSKGNHVIRYNEVYSDADHYFNDALGAGSNFSLEGFPNSDSDIYGNFIAQCWDDGIEAEGANRNVRIWGNYIESTYVAIAAAATSVGPLYVWRNVYGLSRRSDVKSWNDAGRGGFFKTSDGAHVDRDFLFRGKIFVFHNTTRQPAPPPGVKDSLGCSVGLGWGGPTLNVTSRNNVLHVHKPWNRSINDRKKDPLGDYDYDLYSGKISAAEGVERHGVHAEPIYDPSNGEGEFALDPSSPGYDAGALLLNFNDGFTGAAPDMGAHERGTPPMEFGVNAYLGKVSGALNRR
jgi:hypothetical protein